MADKKHLGRGLGSLFGDNVDAILEDIQEGRSKDVSNKQVEIDIEQIRPNPYQPRKEFDQKALKELCASIKEHGIFTPVLLRESVQGYELIAGERRWRAAKMAGLTKVPAIIVEFTDEQMMEISILENVQRENLNPIEEANAYDSLIKRLGYTQEKLAQRVGKSREYCANIMRLLKLPPEVQEFVVKKQLTMGHVRPLITLEDEDQMYDVAVMAIDKKMSVREVEQYIKSRDPEEEKKKKVVKEKDPNLTYVENLLELKLQTKVEVDKKQISIKYTTTNDLNRILELLGAIEE